MQYNLIDIHFHTNLSYDAYKNIQNGIKYDINKIFNHSNVKMICITDHNLFDYKEYLLKEKEFSDINIKTLPGMELTIDGIHWIIITDDIKLSQDMIGEKFSQELMSKIGIDVNNYNVSDLQTKMFNVSDVISTLEKYDINYIAIPHLDKDKGIFHNGKIEQKQIDVFLNYLRDNIVYGFETKYHEQFFIKKIEEINKNIKILEENNSDKVIHLYEQLKNLDSAKKLSSAFIYGSDYHGKGDIEYKDIQDNLFCIKSECSFQGLRLALLDYDSRVFSKDRFEQYNKDKNKIIEEIVINVNGINKTIKFGDGLNSIIGSRGTGKSYLLKAMMGETNDYIKSDIYNQIKFEYVKLRNEGSKKYLDEQIDVDYISQKNSGKYNSNNIYDLLSEAPYDTEKFVTKIRNLSTTTNKVTNINDYFKNVNECLNSFILLDTKKNQAFDYSFMTTYNSFYTSSGEIFKIVKLFDSYLDFCTSHVKKIEIENTELVKFNGVLDELEKYILFVSKIKNYDFKNYQSLNKNIEELRRANNNRINVNLKNIQRIKKTEIFITKMKDKVAKNISNEGQYYSNGFNNLSLRIKQLINLMSDCTKKSKLINALNSNPIVNEEDIIINKNNVSINLTIRYELDVKNKNIAELQEVFRNYNNLFMTNLNYIDLFKNFGEKFIKEIYPNKDKRITKGDYNGYDVFVPKLIPTITINYNGIKKDISKLSPGEKADILLDLILDPNSSKILVIDQPEDDLDNETIFKKVVLKLRTIKMRRQVLIISHNANLVINGDSDNIVVCMKENDKYEIINDTMESLTKYDYSSINTIKLKDTILNISTHILDGGRDALSMRVKKIGYKDIFLEEENNETSI